MSSTSATSLFTTAHRAVVLGLFLALAACGDDGDDGDTSRPDGDGGDVDTGGGDTDTGGGETDTVADVDTVDVPDTGTDTTDTVTTDTQPAETIEPTQDFREACLTNGECLSGFCVPSADGNVCTKDCLEGCPGGWGCGRVLNPLVDQVEVCLDRGATLCHPCSEDDDCRLFTGDILNRCLDFERADGTGLAGRFCGISCNATDTCPEGYVCVDDAGAPAEGDGQCRPEAGECTCNDLAVDLELVTVCTSLNEAGTCSGLRGCGDGSLSACDAVPALVETCNAQDDDCDGLTDEDVGTGGDCEIDNGLGVCPGREYCIAGQRECLGVAAQVEICDGNDQNCDGAIDEGFPNFDGDTQADCQDPDDDDDGTLDGEDCDPLDPARSQSAEEVCGNDLDDDCDGEKEEAGSTGCVTYFQDVDGDTFGSDVAEGRCLCAPDPVTFYVVQNTDDCNDLESVVKPGGEEVCNNLDDSCDGTTDEGVQAPCGGCVNICFLEAGPSGLVDFSLANATNLSLDGSGNLRLAAGQTSGTYRVQWVGWPNDGTNWDVVFLEVTHPSDETSVSVRWRTSSTQGGLAGAVFTPYLGPYPPDSFPIYVETSNHAIELEVKLDTTNTSRTPTIRGISILAAID